MYQHPDESTGERARRATATRDDLLRLLASGRRRTLIGVLGERSPPVDLATLAVAVAEREAGSEPVEGVATTLHHVHLPKLADAGVVDYDPTRGRVESIDDRLVG